MKVSLKSHLSFMLKSLKRAIQEGDGISDMQKKERIISAVLFILIVIITVAFMMIVLNI